MMLVGASWSVLSCIRNSLVLNMLNYLSSCDYQLTAWAFACAMSHHSSKSRSTSCLLCLRHHASFQHKTLHLRTLLDDRLQT